RRPTMQRHAGEVDRDVGAADGDRRVIEVDGLDVVRPWRQPRGPANHRSGRRPLDERRETQRQQRQRTQTHPPILVRFLYDEPRMQPAQRVLLRLVGLVTLALALFLGWKSRWFHIESDLSRYPQIELTYTTAKFERITHSRGSTTRQLDLIT